MAEAIDDPQAQDAEEAGAHGEEGRWRRIPFLGDGHAVGDEAPAQAGVEVLERPGQDVHVFQSGSDVGQAGPVYRRGRHRRCGGADESGLLRKRTNGRHRFERKLGGEANRLPGLQFRRRAGARCVGNCLADGAADIGRGPVGQEAPTAQEDAGRRIAGRREGLRRRIVVELGQRPVAVTAGGRKELHAPFQVERSPGSNRRGDGNRGREGARQTALRDQSGVVRARIANRPPGRLLDGEPVRNRLHGALSRPAR